MVSQGGYVRLSCWSPPDADEASQGGGGENKSRVLRIPLSSLRFFGRPFGTGTPSRMTRCNVVLVVTLSSPRSLPRTVIRGRGSSIHAKQLYFPDLVRLSCIHSIWQFSAVVFPPSCHGFIWSASISSIVHFFFLFVPLHSGQIPFWRS